jgi:hypothetical protein
MNYSRFVLLALVASAALSGSAAGHSDATGSGPKATTSTAFLTVAEARQATRREVLRIARKRDEGPVHDFEIKWCRRHSGVRVGCRYEMWLEDGWRASICHGGSRVTERSEGRHVTRTWRDCHLSSDG